jgi:hypothetical protein
VFAAVGRLSHGMSVLDFDALRTADPFIAGETRLMNPCFVVEAIIILT